MSSSEVTLSTLEVNGVKYVRADSVPAITPPITGNRHVVVVDRGWIFAGDMVRDNGTITLTNALHLEFWPEGGFSGVIANPKMKGVLLKKMIVPVVIPEGAEIFSCPVDSKWGL